MKRLLLYVRHITCAMLAGIGIFTTGCSKPKYVWSTEEEYFKLPIWKQHVRSYRKLKFPPNTALVFIGDSMTEGFDLDRMLETDDLVNMGISGDFTAGVLNRLDIVEKIQPRKIFIMIGINDILKSVGMDRITSQYDRIISELQQKCPASEIFIQANLPTTLMGGTIESNQVVLSRVHELNTFLVAKCAEKSVAFIDLYPYFEVDGGLLNPLYTYDGLHLSENGYVVWAEQVKPFLQGR